MQAWALGRARGEQMGAGRADEKALGVQGRSEGAAITQASITGRQGDPSNPQRFRTYHLPTFTGGRDPMVVDHWFM